MMNKIRIIAAILILASPLCFAQKTTIVPVIVGSNNNLDACPGLGKVSGLKSIKSSFLAVRSGPGKNYAIANTLKANQRVYICSSSRDGKWLGIVFSFHDMNECGVTSPINPKQKYEGSCRSGWVDARWIKLLAG